MTERGNTEKMSALMSLLKRNMHGAVTERMEQLGIHYPCNWGVSIHAIRAAARDFAPDHSFAHFLYRQQLRELQLAAFLIADPKEVTEEELAVWAAGITNTELAENGAFSLLSKTDLVEVIVSRWLDAASPMLLKYSALLTLAKMCDNELPASLPAELVRSVGDRFASDEDVLIRNAAANLLLKLEV